jgi:hypothetical protein
VRLGFPPAGCDIRKLIERMLDDGKLSNIHRLRCYRGAGAKMVAADEFPDDPEAAGVEGQ